MLVNISSKKVSQIIYFVLLISVFTIFIINTSTVFADEPFSVIDILSPLENRGYIFVSNKTIPEIKYNGSLTYVNNSIYIDSPIVWGDNFVTEVTELPSDSVILKLPNDKITIKSSNETINLKTFDISDVGFVNGSYIIVNLSGEYLIYNYPIVDLESTILTTFNNPGVSQRIDNLDEYQIKFSFDELKEVDTNLGITSYTVDWGDNTIATVNDGFSEISHIYKKSGEYPVSINVFYIGDSTLFNTTVNTTIDNPYEGVLFHTYLILKKPENIAVTSVGIGGLALAGFAITETGKYKLIALLSLMIPMYTHIHKDDILDQFVRGEIFGLVKTNPGVHYNEIMKKLDIKNGTLSYHLHMLEKMEMVKSRREGFRYRAFYPIEMKFPQEERYRLSDFQVKILKVIKENEGIHQKDIAKKLGKKPQTINYNVKILQQAGLIKIKKKGRETSCYILKESDDNQNDSP